MYLLEVNGKKLLMECGLFQGKRDESIERNRFLMEYLQRYPETWHGSNAGNRIRFHATPPESTPGTFLFGLVHALVAARKAYSAGNDRAFSVAVVGLGAGSMTCHSKPGEAWRVFEIDPVVVGIACVGQCGGQRLELPVSPEHPALLLRLGAG